MSSIGEILKEAREKLGFQQQYVADKVGVTPAYICKLEKGTNPPSNEVCEKLAKVLKLDAQNLRMMAMAARQKIDLETLIASIKDDPLAGLTPDEVKLVREWRKLDSEWKEKIINLILKAQEILGVLEEAEKDLRKKGGKK